MEINAGIGLLSHPKDGMVSSDTAMTAVQVVAAGIEPQTFLIQRQMSQLLSHPVTQTPPKATIAVKYSIRNPVTAPVIAAEAHIYRKYIFFFFCFCL